MVLFKKCVHKFEKKFLTNPCTETKLALSLAKKNYKSIISRSKSIYYNKKIALISSDPRKLIKIISPPDEKILPILPKMSNFHICLFLKNSLKIKLQSLIILFEHLLHPYSILLTQVYSLSLHYMK